MKTLTIHIPDRFDFMQHRWFSQEHRLVDNETSVTLDFSKTAYIDSSALGMMLLLRDKALNVNIVNCTDNAMQIFKIANFQKLFEIS